jgi:MFS family permease
MEAQPRSAGQEWKAHWPVVLSAMLGMSFYTVVTYSFGAFIGPVTKAFGWDREHISLGLTIFAAIATLGGPFVGALLDRVGTRTMAIAGTVASGAAFAAFSLASGSLTQWYMLWVIYGIAALFIKSTIWSAGVSNLFTTSRGLALASMLSGSALGQILAPIIATALVGAEGWRGAYVWLGAGWAGITLVLLVLFYRDGRERGGNRTVAASRPVPLLPGLTVREGMRDSRLIRICLANVLMSTVGSGVTVHMIPLISETHVSMATAAKVAASAGIGGFVGKFLTGWLLDRKQGSLVPFFSFAIAALGHFLLLNSLHSVAALALGAMILGYASGAGLQVSTYLVSRYAGMRSFGALFGTIASAMMLGTALGPPIAGKVHDVFQSYDPLLWAAIPVMLLCALLFVGLGPYPVFASPAPTQEDPIEAQLAE